MKQFGLTNWCILALYLILLVLIGYVCKRRGRTADDFFRGGGRVPWWAAGISIYATMLSALTYMGIPAKAFAGNWTYYPILITILPVGLLVVRYYLPKFRNLNLTSAYGYLEVRFSLPTRLLASGYFILYMLARTALVLYLPSLALSTVTGIELPLCILLTGGVTVVYCTLGGIEAVIWGDVLQGGILAGGVVFLALWLVEHTEGGLEGFVQMGLEHHKFDLFDLSWDYRSVSIWVALVGGAANNLISLTSDQTVIQRYLTTPNERSAARGILFNGLMCVFISIFFYIVGAGLWMFYQAHPDRFSADMTNHLDVLLPYFMMQEMPQGVAGLLVAAIFAATMSTISSNINSVSTAFSIDFWKRLRLRTNEQSLLRVARLSSLATGLLGIGLALMMATWNIQSLIDYFNTILGLLTGALGGLFVVGVFLPRVHARAALTGFCVGNGAVVWLAYGTEANFFLYGAFGILVTVTTAIGAQKLVFGVEN